MTIFRSSVSVNDLVTVGLGQRARVVAVDRTHVGVLILEDAFLSEFAKGTCWSFDRRDVRPCHQLTLEVA